MINLFQSSLFAALPGLLNSILLRKTGYPEMNLGHVNLVSFLFYLSSVSKSIIALRSIAYLETWLNWQQAQQPRIKRNLGRLNYHVFQRRTSTGNGLFAFFSIGFVQVFGQIVPLLPQITSGWRASLKNAFASSSSPSKSKILAHLLISSVFLPSWTFQKGTACGVVVQDGFVTKLFVSEFLPLTSYNTR